MLSEEIRQTALYDFNDIVAAVGGSLGMFIGFSCFQCGKGVLDWVFQLCSLARTNKKAANNMVLHC